MDIANILVVPIGEVEPDTLGSIGRVLQETYHCETVVGEPLTVPQEAYSARREQYHSTKLLTKLEARKPDTCDIMLGVIDKDLYVPELNFVFGEADPSEGVAVIGLPRLRQEYYGLDPDIELFLLRAAKEAIHETGHTCGLGHCSDHRCIMHFSNSLRDTDVKGPRFCDRCRTKLAASSS
jgi:archaemetzincin